MPDEKLPLILHPSADLALNRSQGGRIVTEMVGEVLALSRTVANASEALVPRFKIGEHVFCEPDYRQILLWSKALKLEPQAVLERLLTAPEKTWEQEYKTHFANGRMIKVYFDGSLLELAKLNWVGGLIIDSFAYKAPWNRESVAIQTLSLALPKLKYLYCNGPDPEIPHFIKQGHFTHFLTHLDLSAVPLLEDLRCHDNRLTELDISDLPLLKKLRCESNQLTELDLCGLSQLAELRCGGNQLKELVHSGLPKLTMLDCMCNQLTDLDLANLPLLTSMDCRGNQLTDLDLANLPLLTSLDCTSNQLWDLDLSALPMLKTLWCCYNELTELDLSALPLLTRLHCRGNQLTDLDLLDLPLLTELGCENNELTELNLSGMPMLTRLTCAENQLTELDIRPLKALKWLDYDKHQTLLIQRPDQHF